MLIHIKFYAMCYVYYICHIYVYICACMYSYVCRFFRGCMALVIDGKVHYQTLFSYFLNNTTKVRKYKIKKDLHF